MDLKQGNGRHVSAPLPGERTRMLVLFPELHHPAAVNEEVISMKGNPADN